MLTSTNIKTTCINSIKCQQQKKAIRRELQNWQKKVPILLGLETVLSTALGLSSEEMNTGDNEEIRDWDPSGADDICIQCEPTTSLSHTTLDEKFLSVSHDSSMIIDNRGDSMIYEEEMLNGHYSQLPYDDQMEPLDLSGVATNSAFTDKTSLSESMKNRTNGRWLQERKNDVASPQLTPNHTNILPSTGSSSVNDFTNIFKASSLFLPVSHSQITPSSILSPTSSAFTKPLITNSDSSCIIPPAPSHQTSLPSSILHYQDEDSPLSPTLALSNYSTKAHRNSSGLLTKRVYTEKELTQAVRAICNGHLGTRRAAAVFGIPRSTLRNKICKLHDMKRKEELATGKAISLAELMTNMTEENNLFQVSCRRENAATSKFPIGDFEDKRQSYSLEFLEQVAKEDKNEHLRNSTNFTSKLSLPSEMTQLGSIKPTSHQIDEMEADHSTENHMNGTLSTSEVKLDNNFSSSYIPQLAAAAAASTGSSLDKVKEMANIDSPDIASSSKWDDSNNSSSNQLYEAYVQMTQQFLLPFLPHLMSAFLEQMLPPEKYEAFLEALKKQQQQSGGESSSLLHCPESESSISSLFNTMSATCKEEQIKSSFSVNSLLNNAAAAAAAAAGMNLGVFRDLPYSTNSTANSSSSTPSPLDISHLSHSLANGYGSAAVIAAISRLPQQQSFPGKESSTSSSSKSKHKGNNSIFGAIPIQKQDDMTITASPTAQNSHIHVPIKKETLTAPSESNASNSSTPASAKNRSKRGHYRKYNSTALQEAVKAVQSGQMSVHKAGSHYGVPHSTLEYKVKERHLLKAKKRQIENNAVEPTHLKGDYSLSFIPSSASGSTSSSHRMLLPDSSTKQLVGTEVPFIPSK